MRFSAERVLALLYSRQSLASASEAVALLNVAPYIMNVTLQLHLCCHSIVPPKGLEGRGRNKGEAKIVLGGRGGLAGSGCA